MVDDPSSPVNSRRRFLKRASLIAVAGYARPITALASTTAPPRASAPTDLFEEFGYGDVQLAPGLPHDQFEQTQRVMLLKVRRTDDGYWQAGSVRFGPFPAIHDAPYTAYVRLA